MVTKILKQEKIDDCSFLTEENNMQNNSKNGNGNYPPINITIVNDSANTRSSDSGSRYDISEQPVVVQPVVSPNITDNHQQLYYEYLNNPISKVYTFDEVLDIMEEQEKQNPTVPKVPKIPALPVQDDDDEDTPTPTLPGGIKPLPVKSDKAKKINQLVELEPQPEKQKITCYEKFYPAFA